MRDKLEQVDRYIATLEKAQAAQSDARASVYMAERLVQANKTIVHLERCLRRARNKCKAQHRALRALSKLEHKENR